jgi:hypothetical protein
MILMAFMIISSIPAQSYGENTASSFTSKGSPGAVTLTPQSFKYNGKHSDWVRKLLTRVGGWECPSNDGESGTPPKVKAKTCNRDHAVAAAVQYAWAAECYARNEEDSKAQSAAEKMYKELELAQAYCSDTPSFAGAGECDTMRIFGCGEL